MKTNFIRGFGFLLVTVILISCGKSDSTPMALQTPPPFPPGGPQYQSNCLSGRIYQGNRFNLQTWGSGGQIYSTGVVLCSNSTITIRGSSEDELFISNGTSERYSVSREEIAQGVSIPMRNSGVLYWGCARCRKLKVRFDELRVNY